MEGFFKSMEVLVIEHSKVSRTDGWFLKDSYFWPSYWI